MAAATKQSRGGRDFSRTHIQTGRVGFTADFTAPSSAGPGPSRTMFVPAVAAITWLPRAAPSRKRMSYSGPSSSTPGGSRFLVGIGSSSVCRPAHLRPRITASLDQTETLARGGKQRRGIVVPASLRTGEPTRIGGAMPGNPWSPATRRYTNPDVADTLPGRILPPKSASSWSVRRSTHRAPHRVP